MKETLRTLNKGLPDNKEVTKYKGEYYLLHICQNNNPVPLFHSKNPQKVRDYMEPNSPDR